MPSPARRYVQPEGLPLNLRHPAWQEKYGPQEQTITVAAKDSKTADFTFKP